MKKLIGNNLVQGQRLFYIYGIFFSYLLIRDFWSYGLKGFVVMEAILALVYVLIGMEFLSLLKRARPFVIGFLAINVLMWLWLLIGYIIVGKTLHLLVSVVGLLGSVFLLLFSVRNPASPLPNH